MRTVGLALVAAASLCLAAPSFANEPASTRQGGVQLAQLGQAAEVGSARRKVRVVRKPVVRGTVVSPVMRPVHERHQSYRR